MATLTLDAKIGRRLLTEQNIWLATVRSNGRPHLVPIWFVWVDRKIFICTGADSVKARNVLSNPHVSVSLENGNQPVVIEGQARFAPIESVNRSVVEAFQHKYDWNIETDATYNQVIEIEPTKIRS
jgi:F420H(2)-dependent biliverdin reductase